MSSVAAILRAPQVWTGIEWPGARVVILASGTSLTPAQLETVHEWRFAEASGMRRVIAINTTFRAAPWADVLYACDAPWWDHYDKKVRAGEWEPFPGRRWTQDVRAVREHAGLRLIESNNAPGLGRRPGVIHQGGNGGYQAVNLAYQAGARRMVLLGFDMHGGHWHGPHPAGLPNTQPYLFKAWCQNFVRMAQELEHDGVEVFNCSPGTALTAFPMRDLTEVLR